MGYLRGFLVVVRAAGSRAARHDRPTRSEKRAKPMRLHGRHVLNRYEDGMEKCIGCELCAGVCPARCIYVRGADNDPAEPGQPGERYGFVYEINYLRCIHCDLCVEACPTEAITESKLFEFSFTNRADAIYTQGTNCWSTTTACPQQLPWEDWRDGERRVATSAWMRATAPSGDAAYEGKVAWARRARLRRARTRAGPDAPRSTRRQSRLSHDRRRSTRTRPAPSPRQAHRSALGRSTSRAVSTDGRLSSLSSAR